MGKAFEEIQAGLVVNGDMNAGNPFSSFRRRPESSGFNNFLGAGTRPA